MLDRDKNFQVSMLYKLSKLRKQSFTYLGFFCSPFSKSYDYTHVPTVPVSIHFKQKGFMFGHLFCYEWTMDMSTKSNLWFNCSTILNYLRVIGKICSSLFKWKTVQKSTFGPSAQTSLTHNHKCLVVTGTITLYFIRSVPSKHFWKKIT